MNTVGKVYLIGAGPGDPELITVKGMRYLRMAEVVIYDNLVSEKLIVELPPHVETYYVGKKAGDHPVPQEEINKLMLRLAREGKRVVRLKGSDPLIFGRGGEEAKYLKEHNIPFEIVCGITAGIAAPAYNGIPCTDRDKASFVMFVTGHKASDKLKSTVPWEWVAKAKGGTVVIYMGVHEIDNIVEQLIDGGMAPELPAAVIERGTFPSQKLGIGTLKELPQVVKEKDIHPPAIFILGEVVKLQHWLEWYHDLPLQGQRVMVTRPADQSHEVFARLCRLGAEPMPYPTIMTVPHNDNAGWQAFDRITSDKRWLVFTSENGVRCFARQFVERYRDVRRLAGWQIAAIGPGTMKALEREKWTVDFTPSRMLGKIVGEELAAEIDAPNTAIVRVRGNLAGDDAERILTDVGADVLPLTVYETRHRIWPDGFREKLFDHPPHAIMFTSASTVSGLAANLNEDELKTLTSKAKLFSMGPMVTAALEEHGLAPSREAAPHSLDGMIEAILAECGQKTPATS